MYSNIKNIVKLIFPKHLLFKCEPFIRKVLYLFYVGKTYRCNICNKGLRKFIKQPNGDYACPYCGSLSRTRRLWSVLNSWYLIEEQHILDFSPSRCLYRSLKKNKSVLYQSSDLSGDFLADFRFDITNIDAATDQFDLIICYHILEHIEDDRSAISELYRVLKPGGKILIQTPFKEGNTYEDAAITSESDRILHFGQKDHVRIYSSTDLKDRLIDSAFKVEIKRFTESENNIYGLKTFEEILTATK